MPGAYAHIAMANRAQKRAAEAALRPQTLLAVGRYLKYVELGAVSPDYPYLALHKPSQKVWADRMHYTSTSALLRAGVRAVKALPAPDRAKGTAWFLGFAAHMAMDMTIHPVVELRVGPYKGNEAEHRRCEMHQDALIFPKVFDLGEAGLTRHLDSGIGACATPGNPSNLDTVVAGVWSSMLAAAYGGDQDAPDFDAWHAGFRHVLGAMAQANALLPFARHVAAGLNLSYPPADAIDAGYTQALKTPEGPMDYEAIFALAEASVLRTWRRLDDAMARDEDDPLADVDDWNLDTGRSLKTGGLVFWREGHDENPLPCRRAARLRRRVRAGRPGDEHAGFGPEQGFGGRGRHGAL